MFPFEAKRDPRLITGIAGCSAQNGDSFQGVVSKRPITQVHVKKKSAHLCTLYFSYKELDYNPFQMKVKPTNQLQDAGVPEKYES